jgi:hypothetical protein
MSPLPALVPTISAPVLRARLAARGLDEANHSNGLDQGAVPEQQLRSGGERRRNPSHSGTARHSWTGPASPFAAQVLGQVMAGHDAHASILAQAAYRDASGIAPGSFFDAGI